MLEDLMMERRNRQMPGDIKRALDMDYKTREAAGRNKVEMEQNLANDASNQRLNKHYDQLEIKDHMESVNH